MKDKLTPLILGLSSLFLFAFSAPITHQDLESHEWVGHIIQEGQVEDLDLVVTFTPEVMDLSLDFDQLWDLIVVDNPEADNALVKTLTKGVLKKITNESYEYALNEGVLTLVIDNFYSGIEVTFLIDPQEDSLLLTIPEDYTMNHPELQQIIDDYDVDLSDVTIELIPAGEV